MDKYTVDLDQVLNDFEYSELTDQPSRSVPGKSQNNVQLPSPPVTKHSITNVFNSLNEYLNSEISSTSSVLLKQEENDNKYSELCTETSNGPQVQIEDNLGFSFNAEEDHKPNTAEPLKTDTENSLVALKADSVCTENVDVNINIDKECDKTNGDKADSTLENEIRNPVDSFSDVDECTENKSNVSKSEVLNNVEIVKIEENFIIEPSVSPYALGAENSEGQGKDVEEEQSNISDSNQNIQENNDSKDKTPALDSIPTSQDVFKIGFSTDIDKEERETKTLASDLLPGVGSELIPTTNETSKVGFSTDIDIDENELNKMLEDLELEANDGRNCEPVENDQEEVLHENDLTPEERKEAVHKEGNEGLEPEEQALEEPECLEKLEASNNSSSTVLEYVNEAKKVENMEVNEEELSASEEETAIPEKNKLEKEASQDLSDRPQSLPLKSEATNKDSSRTIDLIGSPGSTPYNNVYIHKSIEPKDAEFSSSASPTFSECSTESTSTASTASVEDLPNNPDRKNPQKSDENNATDVKQEQVNTEESQGATSLNNETSGDAGGGGDDIQHQSTDSFIDKAWLGKQAPLWIPDADAAACLHCDMKFTVIKRRHHCRACGLVLCSKCCNLKFRLEYLDAEARVCNKCYTILNRDTSNLDSSQDSLEVGHSPTFRPNPNNPLEYCSTVSPLQQAGQGGASPPSVMVPVGVLKRKGSNKKSNKSVMFCDGIAPGSDLTNLDQDFNYNLESKTLNAPHKPQEEPQEPKKAEARPAAFKGSRNHPKIDPDTGCFIPKNETSLPPTVCFNKTEMLYSECSNVPSVVEMLKNEALVFAINQNLFIHLKVIDMRCCVNKQAWCFSTEGLINVGSDEVVYLIEYIEEECFVPKDVFFHIHNVYLDAVKGTSVKELSLTLHNTSNFLDSKNHAGFVYIRATFQCLDNIIKPKEPFLIGILIHRWETPWAKLFPLRLILRLGAEYRYYPSPIISTRHRDSVFVEIGHTIISLLADFRNFSFTLSQIRGLVIHVEDKTTTITIPKNRYDQVMKSINNSGEHILAFAGNFSRKADSHLVCIQDTQGHENKYTTHAINIHNKPRKVTGASFLLFNGSLKSGSGLTAKSNIVEDGLMIQVLYKEMEKIRDSLRNMKDYTITLGAVNAVSEERVHIVWGENDVDFNVGVKSPIDSKKMNGVPSIRVHNGKDYVCGNGARLIRWTEVFILQSGEENPKNQDPVDISKVSESIAKACCTALVKYLDLLVSNSCQKIAVRATLHVENVAYAAGSNGLKLPPIYMKSLDNELIPVLHKITSNNLGDNAIVLELIFRILNA